MAELFRELLFVVGFVFTAVAIAAIVLFVFPHAADRIEEEPGSREW